MFLYVCTYVVVHVFESPHVFCRSHLSMSLLVKFPNVPEDGYTLSEYDRSCDVTEKFCKTPVHVWEIHCPECRAAGKVPVHRKRKNRILSPQQILHILE